MAKQFGKEPLHIGMVCLLQDTCYRKEHRPVDHMTCRVRAVEVGEDGYIRVGVSFGGHSGDRDDTVDSDGFSSQVSSWVFPHSLRAK